MQSDACSGINPILHGEGVKLTPPCRLLYVNRRWTPQIGWFLVTLFLATVVYRRWLFEAVAKDVAVDRKTLKFFKKFQKLSPQDFSNISRNKVTKNKPIQGIQWQVLFGFYYKYSTFSVSGLWFWDRTVRLIGTFENFWNLYV